MAAGRALVGAGLEAWALLRSARQKLGPLPRLEVISSLLAGLAVGTLAFHVLRPAAALKDRPSGHIEYDDQRAAQLERRNAIESEVRFRGGETLTAAYGGAQFTYPSDVQIQRPGTDLTIHQVPWEGRPFDHPIYYGVRVARWFPASSFGGMVDFTHSSRKRAPSPP